MYGYRSGCEQFDAENGQIVSHILQIAGLGSQGQQGGHRGEGTRSDTEVRMTNPVSNHDMKVFSGLSNPDLSKRLARYCGVTVSLADFCLYVNGETLCAAVLR